MNCACDAGPKDEIWKLDPGDLPTQEAFPLELLCVFVGKEKMTSNTGLSIWFWYHRKLAKACFFWEKLILPDQFVQVDWPMVHDFFPVVPHMFQVWVSRLWVLLAQTSISYNTNRIKPKTPKI